MRKLLMCLSILALCGPTPVASQAEARPEILIVGTYHMANPGRDVHNMEADDVLSDRRQREIAELIDVLKRFRPTHVAVEAPVGSSRVTDRYEEYLAGEDTLTRNETHQIGFRLAREMELETVHPVDEDGRFPYLRVLHYAKANGMEEKFDSLRAEGSSYVEHLDQFLREHTVLETLELMNSDSASARGVAAYYGFVPFGQRYAYAGPDLVAAWFKRNIRIYHNIRAIVSSPSDRILVVYGAGHLGWLRQMVEDDPGVRLRKLSDLLQ